MREAIPGESDPRAALREVLHRALDLPPQERRGYVQARLQRGATLEDALSLLEGAEHIDGFLERPLVPAPETFRPPLPEHIGAYRIERVLGFGSMGVVYLAQQASPARRVAVKVLRLDSASPTAAERFERESLLLARLSHPGIAAVHEAGVADLGSGRQPWFAMEFVDGEPLSAYAERLSLDRRARVRLVRELADAIQYAHEQGVVHRDLKPENVLVRADGTTCVLDFGIAQSTRDEASLLTLTLSGQVLGTLAYMAPEQARGGVVDARADQFALGAMLYELLTGELPFAVRGRLPHEALRVIADGSWTSPTRFDPSLAGDLEAILATALAPEPNRRYASMRAFGADLERWLSDRPVLARPPSRAQALARVLRRNPLQVGAAALTLLLVGAGVAIALSAVVERRRESQIASLFSDRALLTDLVARADGLWPTGSERLPDFDAWLLDANALVARLAVQRRTLEAIGARKLAAASQAADEPGSGWLLAEGRALVSGLEDFTRAGGLLERVRADRDLAEQLWSHTVLDRRDDWAAAAARVRADVRFDGLGLEPQEGLVPLGPDPRSRLEEFALFGTGELPQRDSASGHLLVRPEDALTLVLVPGGETWIGAQAEDPDGPNFDAYVVNESGREHEGPPFQVVLESFLISKFELTQAQWLRLFGFNPSDWEIGSDIKGVTIGPLHPVESLSWQQALELLPRMGLTLPTEAQWELAARGGSPHARIAGPALRDLVGHVNANTFDSELVGESRLLPDDGFYSHMPVGSLEPNPFGLHDVLGNVWELCLDTFKVRYHQLGHRPGDGLVLAEPDGDVSRRGLSSGESLASTDLYVRQTKRFDGRDSLTGLRPARALRARTSRDLGDSWRTPPASND